MSKPFILGLTGSIGMGKSTVAAMFERLGVPVFDADAEVRRMQAAGGSLIPAIRAAFPDAIVEGAVDRAALGARVFDDSAAMERLEAIVHPAVYAARDAFLIEHAAAPLVVFDIPLLFEKDRAAEVDAVAVVSAPEDVQRARVLARPDMTPQRFASILALQMPDADKRSRADHIIDTGAPLMQTEAQVARLVDKLPG